MAPQQPQQRNYSSLEKNRKIKPQNNTKTKQPQNLRKSNDNANIKGQNKADDTTTTKRSKRIELNVSAKSSHIFYYFIIFGLLVALGGAGLHIWQKNSRTSS